jgi:hypothetical protein
MPRKVVLWGLLLCIGAAAAWFGWAWLRYPSDRTPEGAYLRVMSAVNRRKPEAFFAYTETAAQHACYTIRDFRRQSVPPVKKSYPEPERTALLEKFLPFAEAADGSDVFALYAEKHGWLARLRRDMSGIAKVEINGKRASVETVKGTRYPFRQRENGIWGLTLFTAALTEEAERAARDHDLVNSAAADYQRARQKN